MHRHGSSLLETGPTRVSDRARVGHGEPCRATMHTSQHCAGWSRFTSGTEICLPKPPCVNLFKGILASSLCSFHEVINPRAHPNTQQVIRPHVHGLCVCLERPSNHVKIVNATLLLSDGYKNISMPD